jgi:hypothetical protein
MERYLRERGDKNIHSIADLIAKSTFYDHAPIGGVIAPPKERLEDLLARTERLTKKSDGSLLVRKIPVTTLDISGWHAQRTVLQMLINKVMADNQLDALVYPTKTVLAPRLAEPVEPINLKTAQDKVTVVVKDEEYERSRARHRPASATDAATEPEFRLSDHRGTGGLCKAGLRPCRGSGPRRQQTLRGFCCSEGGGTAGFDRLPGACLQ